MPDGGMWDMSKATMEVVEGEGRRICSTPGCDNLSTNKGDGRYDKYCNGCKRLGKLEKRLGVKKEKCSFCGFIAFHKSQLDIDHIDGDHSNDTIGNLQVLCANCHRLKTHLCSDNLKEKYEGSNK